MAKMMIECKRTLGGPILVNIESISYCHIIENDGYGAKINRLLICFNNGTSLTVENGEEIYRNIKEEALIDEKMEQ